MIDRLSKLYDIVDVHQHRYPMGDSPFPLLTRLLEQAEETAEAVNHLERSDQSPDPGSLADEIKDVLHSALALARRYGIEDRLEAVIDREHLRLTSRSAADPVHKAICYIVQDDHILVFRHRDHSYETVGIQVPAGTVRVGESPADAALREAVEETGLTGLNLTGKLGEAVFDARPYVNQIHHRHFFRLEPTRPVPERWDSTENHDGHGDPTRLECFWIRLADAHVLQAGQSQLIGRLAAET